MEYVIELLVRLKTQDTTALTARDTLRNDMGYEECLDSLEREDYWAVTVDEPSTEAADALAGELATGTKIFVNPNKHTCRVAAREAGGPAAAGLPDEGEAPAGVRRVRVLAGYREDEKAHLVLGTLKTTLGYGDRVRDVRRGTLWTIGVRGADAGAARSRAEEMVETRGIGQGLLVNPHSQTYEVLEG